ncbi:MAG TPA: hypothetical protein VGD67_24680 [Pseudonocardiaceae bacterium]
MPEPDNGGTARRDFIRKAGGVLGAGAAVALTGTAAAAPAAAAGPGIDATRNIGAWTWLNPGGASYWWLSYGGDPGPKLFTADVKSPGIRHNATDFGKAIFNGYTEYYVTIINVGGAGAYHNLEGGGLT